MGVSFVDLALTLLEIGLGNYEAALSSALGIYEEDLLVVGNRDSARHGRGRDALRRPAGSHRCS